MFDRYIPVPPLRCPVCGSPLDGWQGTDGPNGLMIWRQGVAAPLDQSIDDEEVRLAPEQLARVRLPQEFTIHAWCCSERFSVEAVCYSSDGIWSRSELVTAETAKQKQERRGDFKARLHWLSGNAG